MRGEKRKLNYSQKENIWLHLAPWPSVAASWPGRRLGGELCPHGTETRSFKVKLPLPEFRVLSLCSQAILGEAGNQPIASAHHQAEGPTLSSFLHRCLAMTALARILCRMSYFFIFDSVVKCISNMCVGNWNLNMTIKFLYFKYEIQIPWLICHVINIGMAQKNSIKKKLDLNFALCFWNSICTSLCFSLLDVKSSCLCWMDGLRFIKLHIKFSGL